MSLIGTLEAQIAEAWANGIPIIAAEVGPETWKALRTELELGNRVSLPPDTKITRHVFMGIPLRQANVPEGKLWPLGDSQ